MDTHTSKKGDDLGIVFNTSHTDENAKTPSNTKESHLTNKGDVFDVTRVFESEHGESGTIISDKKRTRPSFGTTLGQAFREWWGTTRGAVEKSVNTMPALIKKDSAPTIPKASTRTEIIQEAAKHSTIAPKDDHHVVLEQFHTYKSDVARISGNPGIVLKQPEKKTVLGRWGSSDSKEEKEKEEVLATATPQKFEPIDLRGSMIAPEVGRKIKSEIPRPPTPAPVPHTPDVPVVPQSEKSEPENIPHMVIPENVPKIPVAVPPVITTPAKPVFSSEPIPPTEKSEVVPSPQEEATVPVPVPLAEIIEPTWSSARETQKEIPEPPVVIVEESVSKPVEQPVAVSSSPEFLQKPSVAPIALSVDPHTFPDTEIQNIDKKRSAEALQKPSVVSHHAPRSGFTISPQLILGGAITLIVVLILSVAIFVTRTDDAPASVYAIPSFFTVSGTVGIPLTSDATLFHTQFIEKVEKTGGDSVQIYPTFQEKEIVRPATSKEFFVTLNMSLSRSFLNSLDSALMMGTITTTRPEPYLIIRSYKFDELFAGLLAWEHTMRTDLTPLFGETTASSTLFIDAVASNKSTRILKDETGNEILVYSFINQNTVIITTTGEALAVLVGKF